MGNKRKLNLPPPRDPETITENYNDPVTVKYLYDAMNDFSHFLSIGHSDASYQVSSQLAFRFRRRSEKKIFKMATMAAILDFRSARF